MGKLKEAVEARKNYLINRLIVAGYTKMEDGRQLYELPLADLERMNIHSPAAKHQNISSMSQIYKKSQA
ncbi:Fur-regulated basic protein FbpA [Bacillus sp. CMF12]|uniref:Fur-regulated basic protein FbpA n=1 Tax=Bacillus sp. CMF12 TaxID=2884834 RepID=UPI00207ABEF1|nr:Fur-regulated basic protein FbpA [Bacillus sp. CMF12]USK48890.1 Fur-regulated basic protein FbpA [Bacillus sp. CMF12]